VFFPPFESLFDQGESVTDNKDFRITHYRRQPHRV
jgi:hypothetical protein